MNYDAVSPELEGAHSPELLCSKIQIEGRYAESLKLLGCVMQICPMSENCSALSVKAARSPQTANYPRTCQQIWHYLKVDSSHPG